MTVGASLAGAAVLCLGMGVLFAHAMIWSGDVAEIDRYGEGWFEVAVWFGASLWFLVLALRGVKMA